MIRGQFFAFATLLSLLFTSGTAFACSPCGALSNVTQNVNGTNLELTFTSNAGWECCYTVQIEIVCQNSNFTGVANYQSAQVCINGGNGSSTVNNTPTPYPLTVIDISNFCPGTYQWRAWETGCNIYTNVFTFTVAGQSPIVLTSSSSETSICAGETSQFTANATGGCNNGTMNYSWSPATGLSNPNIANPVASPTTTTTYVVTATESGSCTAPQTDTITLLVDPTPTASISGTTELCDGDSPPVITFNGIGGTGPYTIEYQLNGNQQTAVVTSGGTATIQAPNSPPGTYTYTLISVEDNATGCSQTQNSSAVVTVNPLPNVNAGPDQVICEPNGVTPSDVTLTGSGALTYSWDNGVQNGVPFTPPVGTTIYTVTGTDGNGCSNTDQVSVTSLTLPVPLGSPDHIYGNAPMTVVFQNLSQDAIEYSWDFGDGNTMTTTDLSSVTNTFTTPGIYTVTLTASNGICFDIWTIEIEVIPPMEVENTNIFTPNNDQNNDYYYIKLKYAADFEGTILNRWGNHITDLNGINAVWDGETADGRPLEDGTYFIKYKAIDFNGLEIEGQTYFHLTR